MAIIRPTKVRFFVGREKLVGNIISDNTENEPTLLFLHGAGKATKERSNYIAFELAKHGIRSFSFDFSGHGESSGKLEESSLRKRVEEASAALNFLNHSEAVTLYGSSMGAHTEGARTG
jgi:alpha-beta hydrolase superfamily lysophospholipase